MGISKNKIAILCDYELLPERVGGMDYFFWAFDEKCKENNIQVDWFFPNVSTHGKYANLNIKSTNYQSLEHFFIDFHNKNHTAYSHIITHFLELCTPFYSKLSKISTAKVIAVDHNPRPLNGYPLKKKIQKRIKGLLYSRYINTFIGVSNYTKEELIKDFGTQIKKKIKLIYNGIVLEDIQVRQKRSETKPRFLTASHLRESKGIQDLIHAVFLLSETIKEEIVIDVYGDGPYKTELQNLVISLDLSTCFNFKGSTSNLKSVYCNYDYLLQPTHMECFSLSVLESLAANVPVITTNVGGNQEAVTDGINGYIVNAKNIEELTNIIQSTYFGDKKIEINTRTLIENSFSLKKMVENHWELIRE
ncbi:glycosyltransferase family 4 protein [Flavobacterium sp. ST-87]|uniref:Glycosyltransferase family 4 protein n=1 Tax=Flavobacterium plantiphilum TaxID=3163297 RepID=A0ABW8XWN1_9FLAO